MRHRPMYTCVAFGRQHTVSYTQSVFWGGSSFSKRKLCYTIVDQQLPTTHHHSQRLHQPTICRNSVAASCHQNILQQTNKPSNSQQHQCGIHVSKMQVGCTAALKVFVHASAADKLALRLTPWHCHSEPNYSRVTSKPQQGKLTGLASAQGVQFVAGGKGGGRGGGGVRVGGGSCSGGGGGLGVDWGGTTGRHSAADAAVCVWVCVPGGQHVRVAPPATTFVCWWCVRVLGQWHSIHDRKASSVNRQLLTALKHA